MVRNDQEATRVEALYMPCHHAYEAPGTRNIHAEESVTKVNPPLGAQTHRQGRMTHSDNCERDLLCPSVTFFVIPAAEDGVSIGHLL